MASHIVLGISVSHDCGATLLVDGQVAAAINEERLTRVKQPYGIPWLAIKEVLHVASINPSDINVVALGGATLAGTPSLNNDMSDANGGYGAYVRISEVIEHIPGGGWLIGNLWALSAFQWFRTLASKRTLPALRARLREMGIDAPIKTHDHHKAHIASAYFSSGQPECLVFSNDGFGDMLSSKIAVCRDGQIETVARNGFSNSLGIYYGYVTDICGFPKIYHSGKVTGLAAHGKSEETEKIHRSFIVWDERSGQIVVKRGVFRRLSRRLAAVLDGKSREDIAAGAQALTHDLLVHQLRHFRKVHDIHHVAVCGGVHANVRANQVLAEEPGLKSFYVVPHMGDGGLSLGAAYLAWAQDCKKTASPRRLEHLYLGPKWSDEDIKEALDRNGLTYERPIDLTAALASELAAGKVVARFAGRMEFGPRALGNRSVLYRADDSSVNKWLNARLKRTEFMPFAPVIRDVDIAEMVVGHSEVTQLTAQFMTTTFHATEQCKAEAPAVVHVDGTLRPQVIYRDANPEYYDLVTEYCRLTNKRALINTSFNMHEEPIVCSPLDAIRAFSQAELDVLAIGSFVVTR